MIALFRKLRLKLLAESKFSRYLLYAIGEIFLVVIGILIALGINNWNEQNKLDKAIEDHLEILKENLKEDQVQLQELKKNLSDRKLAADAAMAQMMTLEPVDVRLKNYLLMLYQEYKFSPTTNAIETINQSNEIPALDKTLRTAILDYYALIERTKEREFIANTHIQTKYEPYVNLHYPDIFQKNNDFAFVATYYKKDPRALTMLDEEAFLNDKVLETLLVSRYYQCMFLEAFYERLIMSSERILALIDERNSH